MTTTAQIATAPNVARLNALLPEGHGVQGRTGNFFWTVRGQIMTNAGFYDLRGMIARHFEDMDA